MPPEASTGSSPTAATVAGSSSQIEVVPRTCPPASIPWAMTASTPTVAAAWASATEDDLNPTGVGQRDIGRRVAPEQHHRRHLRGRCCPDLCCQDGPTLLVVVADDEVEAEGPVGQLPGARHQRGNDARGQAIGAEHPKAAGARDGRDQLRAGAPEPTDQIG
jgi:hypothetical protein